MNMTSKFGLRDFCTEGNHSQMKQISVAVTLQICITERQYESRRVIGYSHRSFCDFPQSLKTYSDILPSKRPQLTPKSYIFTMRNLLISFYNNNFCWWSSIVKYPDKAQQDSRQLSDDHLFQNNNHKI